MTSLESAILGLEAALRSPRRDQMWRWQVRQRLVAVKDALSTEWARSADGWLTARQGHLERERAQLIGRIMVMADTVLETADADAVRVELVRLAHDAEHHRQRVNDLVYDSVALELGGSE
jgi:hypothetical protein